MKGKELIISFSLWIVIFFPFLEGPVALNEECPTILFYSGMIEPGPVFSEQFSHESKNFSLLSMNQIMQNETQSKGKSLNVIITGLQYSQDIYMNFVYSQGLMQGHSSW
jgi:hypothetical protein